MQRVYSAQSPKDFKWQIGKTAASIRFVRDAYIFIETCADKGKVRRLKKAIAQVLCGDIILNDWTTPTNYLRKPIGDAAHARRERICP